MWKYYALLSALFAALTAVFAKIGVKEINSDLATAIRTSVILFITWGIVLAGNHTAGVKGISVHGYSLFCPVPPPASRGCSTSRHCRRGMYRVWHR